MNEWSELNRALDVMVTSGAAEVREDGEWLAELTGMRCELRPQGKSALVHLWSDERNLTRRVLRIREQLQAHIVLEVQRFGQQRPGRLEFLLTESRRPGAISRAVAPPARRAFSGRNDRLPHSVP